MERVARISIRARSAEGVNMLKRRPDFYGASAKPNTANTKPNCVLRYNGAIMASQMHETAKSTKTLHRINLRLPPEVFTRVDKAHALRPGSVSRNTWIAEAIQEKLTRELTSGGELPKAAPGGG